jgi:hypothetical protein
MKTPREILLRKHTAAAPKLNRVCEEILATELRRDQGPAAAAFVLKLWRELVWPCRRAWTGMAVLWLVMLWINLGTSEQRPASQEARAKPESATWQALAEQRRLLAELIPPATSQPAEPPRRNHPRPRSQWHEARLAC